MSRRLKWMIAGPVTLVALSTAFWVFTTRAESDWPRLDSLDTLVTAFNADRGAVRIVLLLSPT